MNARDRDILVSQLIAARAQIDATLAVLLPDECPHPQESVLNMTTMGGDDEHYRCGLCGAESAKPFQSLDEQ